MRLSKPNYILPLFALCQIKRKTKQKFLPHRKSYIFLLKYLICESTGGKHVMVLQKSHFMIEV